MNINKIDKRLLEKIAVLNSERKIPCFVFSKDFKRTKQVIKEKGIHILDEYLFINSLFCKASQKEILNLSNVKVVDYIASLSVVNSLMYV